MSSADKHLDDLKARDWWNSYDKMKFQFAKYDDPKICPLPLSCNLKYKKTCYPSPKHFNSFNNCPKAAYYPYLVSDKITKINDEQYLNELLKQIWNNKVSLTTRPKIQQFTSSSNTIQHESVSFFMNEIFNKTNNNKFSISDKMNNLCPFTIGGISLSSKKNLKFNDKSLSFMNKKNDLLSGSQLTNVHIASYGARTPWHHDLGLCTYLQLIYGEKNIKIWDVETTKLIENATINNNKISKLKPKWEIFLRPGCILYLPAGSGHLVTTTSNYAIMITGSFMPINHARIGYEMSKYEDKQYLKQQGLDWNKLIASIFKQNKKYKKMNVKQQLLYLEENKDQANWSKIMKNKKNSLMKCIGNIICLNGETMFECKTCGKTFKQNSKLTRHNRSHTGERPYKCSVCNKTFINIGTLRNHERIHSGNKPYKCNYCNNKFSQKSTLNNHVSIHENEKPYKCFYFKCNKRFRQRSSLLEHEKRHRGEKNIKCKVNGCNKYFVTKNQLTLHTRTHTREKYEVCQYCNQRFIHNAQKHIHIRKYHNN